MNIKITSFRCSKCNVEFSPEEGGKCHKCNKVFCSNHLFRIKKGNELILICKECNSAGRGKIRKNYILKLKENLGKASK